MGEKYTTQMHLAAHHTASAEFHNALAEQHQRHAEDCDNLAECMKTAGQEDAAKQCRSMAKRHRSLAALHAAESERHAGLAKRVEMMTSTKAMSDQIEPYGVSRIPLHPVPRHGAPALSGLAPVPAAFEKFVAIEEG